MGYKNYELTGDEFMYSVGVQFKAMNATGDFTFDTKIFDKDAVEGEVVYVFNYSDWDLEFYTFLGYDGSECRGWQWDKADGSVEIVKSFTVSQGDNLWLMVGEDPVVSGEVDASGSQTIEFTVSEDDWMFEFANPYPIATTFEDLESFCQEGDCVYVFNHVEWDLEFYTYLGNSSWQYDKAGGAVEVLNDKKAVVLDIGEGGFLLPGGNRSWTVTCEY